MFFKLVPALIITTRHEWGERDGEGLGHNPGQTRTWVPKGMQAHVTFLLIQFLTDQ